MDTTFSHLLGDIRQPVLVLGDDPDTEGNVLVAAFQPAQSVPAANVYEAAVASPTDLVDDGSAGKVDTSGGTADAPAATFDTRPVGDARDGTAGVSSPDAQQPAAPSGDAPAFTDNGDGTWTRQSDGARGHFGPDGFVPSGGEQVTGVNWGDAQGTTGGL